MVLAVFYNVLCRAELNCQMRLLAHLTTELPGRSHLTGTNIHSSNNFPTPIDYQYSLLGIHKKA